MNALKFLAFFSLFYGGFLVLTYGVFAYSALLRHEFLPIFPQYAGGRFESRNVSFPSNFSSPFVSPRFERVPPDPLKHVLSPAALGIFFTGIAFLVNSFFLFKHVYSRERREQRNFIVSSLLTEDEKIVYDALAKRGGELTQKQVSALTGFSAVKVYRVLKRLESKNVVKSFPFGMTKKIILREE